MKRIMDTHHLITRLEIAAKKSLYFADQEEQKALHSIQYSANIHNSRAHSREAYFREKHALVLSLIKEIKSFDGNHTEEEKEEIFFIARKLITEISSPWIRRSMLSEDLYGELYRDIHFIPYAKDLLGKQNRLAQSELTILGLPHHIEVELVYELRLKKRGEIKKDLLPSVEDVLFYKSDLKNMFKDSWTQKANLVLFRLYELGIG